MPPFNAEDFEEFIRTKSGLTAEQMRRAVAVRGESNEPLQFVLTSLGLMSERKVLEVISSITGLDVITADQLPRARLSVESLPTAFLKSARLLPISDVDGKLTIATADPFDNFSVRAVARRLGQPLEFRIIGITDFEAHFKRLYESENETADLGISEGGQVEDVERIRDQTSDTPTIRWINQTLIHALELRASDIHLQPNENGLRVRMRIDGALREKGGPPFTDRDAIISRLKLLGKLDIGERRLPQDGRAQATIRGKEIDLRVSTIPSLHGESVVVRILDIGRVKQQFEDLGFSSGATSRIRQGIEKPNGIVLVTGPTGSGKTTTLYAAIKELNSPSRNVLTIEDPIEYRIAGVTQMQVKPDINLNFASALRHFLRHDPDVIMVGEIRDRETAEIAIQAALTGHLVLATLHTNDASSAITRLLDMGIEPFLITSTLNAVIAQRLVRVLCESCKVISSVEERYHDIADGRHFRPAGCDECGEVGYLGRQVISEVLLPSDEIRSAIMRQAPASDLVNAARLNGMMTMREDGLEKARAGITSVAEVMQVTMQ